MIVEDKIRFLVWTAVVMNDTVRVLKFYGKISRRPANFDFRSCLLPLIILCREQRVGFAGLGELRKFIEVFEQVRPPHGKSPAQLLRQGIQSAASYKTWLIRKFPDAFQRRMPDDILPDIGTRRELN
jgi:hypothetical protein